MDSNILKEKFQELHLENQISAQEVPEIDLYMDQVIQLFENKLGSTKRTDDDKVLTKTMVNNYAKGKLLMSIKNKKYSKEHIILMSIICNLKGSLSIRDIKSSLNNIIAKIESEEEYPLRDLYNKYLDQYNNDLIDAEISVNEKNEIIIEKLSNSEENLGEFEETFLLLCSLVNMSNIYRRMSEKLIDDYFNNL
ncbi:DUF1836 domain-containing protein [Clostridium chauvoei]|uniref:DUF1836 domain-containing protein n=2 Tax=Clostridium chauvoei TaxID=46867 RepID=A0A1U6IQT1_9CLOT|nr:DUF1836 domain-containing protein [Clostridium chauvoei]ATD53779.1 hypothetical protein BTM20_00230 [Clostridium chauvoei]ATD56299.1 hypothetical protein BTM21_00230 [Clostridium chauvoei]MBX7281473.1 DUF1836 domain-containing protein [Clostridium chauvoei]MBX7283969.1 DUF1836 domain-containing protein [Clostridium chauvoei]MBX7286521.1 DUF1836 domain-containing protein [Clostridium chauvoei]